jgi:Protein of unknown function (DUF2752)
VSTLGPPAAPLARALRLLAGGAFLLVLARLGAPVCPVAALTHHPCPGCGMTRATVALLHGHLAEAVHLHPLAPILVPLLGAFALYGALRYVREGVWPATSGKGLVWLSVVGIALWALLVAVWIARFYGAFDGPVAV